MLSSITLASATSNSHQPLSPPLNIVEKLLAASHDIQIPSSLLPKKFSSLRASKVSSRRDSYVSAEPSGYFIANQFSGSNDCSTQNTFKYATGTDVCFVGMSNNTAVGSLAYQFNGVSGNTLDLTQRVWDTLDCSGSPTVNPLPIPTTCIASDDENGEDASSSFMYSYSMGASPWTDYAPGFMFQ